MDYWWYKRQIIWRRKSDSTVGVNKAWQYDLTFVSRSPVWPLTFMVHPDLTFYLHRSPRQPHQQSYFILDLEMINHINITILLHVSITHEFYLHWELRMCNFWRINMYLNISFINEELVYLNMYFDSYRYGIYIFQI